MKRQITSLVLFLSIIVMTITGVVMFVMPGGGPGGGGGSQFLGLDKGQHKELHIVFMVPLVVAALLHIVWNIKPLVNYCTTRSSAGRRQVVGVSIAIAIVALFAAGTVARVQPFTGFVQFGRSLSHGGGPGFPQGGPSASVRGAEAAGVPASAGVAPGPGAGAD